MKKVISLCKVDEKRFSVVSSLPNTTEHDVFLFKYSKTKNSVIESHYYTNTIKERDLCGIEYNPIDGFSYVIDRLNCSILKFNKKLRILDEIDLVSKLHRRFNSPVLRDVKFKNDYLFLTDSFSAKNHRVNNCVHVLEEKNFKWIRTIGESILNSPVSISINEHGTEVAVLERSSPGLVKYFTIFGEIIKILHQLECRYPTSFIEPKNNFIILNDEKNIISLYGAEETETVKSEICNIS